MLSPRVQVYFGIGVATKWYPSLSQKVLPLYPKVDLLIFDRCCHYKPSAINDPDLSQIKCFPLDTFHAYRHKGTCPCSPLTQKSLNQGVDYINTSVTEQTFSWFSGYANVLNHMRSLAQ